ncbi:MAG: hypothetical protein H0T87_00480 [Gammaproteobacteria bacterium]|nr:hypothetical protein [Gammaproteobacteria bacterium]
MDFPAYVPAAVRAYITTLIEGRQGWAGWAASITSDDQQLADIERKIQASIRRGEVEYLDSLRREKADIIELRDMSARNVECLKRLAHDSRMRDAFALLTRKFSDDEQWRDFIYAVWAARMDYAPHRERLKRAAELKEEIADAADKLAKLIRQFSETGVDEPGEFYSIPDLLRKTDSRKTHGRNLYMWRSMRPHVLGDPPRRGVPESEPAQGGGVQSIAPEIVTRYLESREKPDVDPAEEARDTLRYGWWAAPCLSALLDTVAKAARDFKPSKSGMIGAAIKPRQQNAKTEYLRAFGNLLTAHNFALTTPIMQAMAFVANVVLNLPDVDVTYDDVRHALAKLGGEALENSGEK